VSLPTADDLFRPTADADTADEADEADGNAAGADAADEAPTAAPASVRSSATKPARAVSAVPEPKPIERARRSSGRVRHDEKMTVYVTADELVDIEHARLTLRRDHGLAVDRGRLVREALAIVLADLEEHGDDSELVGRLIR
jgi:hypothetical protein